MGSFSVVTYTHSLTHSLTQTDSTIAYPSLGSKLQKHSENLVVAVNIEAI